MVHADLSDEDSLNEMARQTRVILSTAGPFMDIGTPVVKACVAQGTHYCDNTGETPWVRQMVDEFHEAAKEKSLHIVPCCGFDSVPSDMGTFMMVQEARKSGGAKWVQSHIQGNGGASGGTIASLLNVVAKVPLKTIRDPHLLDTAGVRSEM